MQAAPLISDHHLGILGLVVGVIGIIIGSVGTFFAVRSDRKMKTAQQAQRRVEEKLLRHMAARNLETMRLDTLSMMGRIKTREWEVVAESSESLGQLVAEILGAWGQLLQPLERDKLDAAVMNIRQFIDSSPTAEPKSQPTEQDVQSMLLPCRRLAEITSEVIGRLNVELMQRTED